ncbi:MAG TPA: hypothetical protein DIW51_01515 [Rhodospirillaceae bacterium]|nr:hypothetical protein [Magnetovibrio sp.]HBT41646.1 hypothetical protein [Rhodospirillaceae bacterium]HCS68626.1 hypothetical protein [Rhodospirillaceae bacterium]|tara:strand:+ start:558 stop:950 length:393 start_codon:yes stop_codon:yes gene_type:complete
MTTFRRTTLAALVLMSAAFVGAQTSAQAADELAQVRVPRLDMLIDARCEGGAAVFRMKNRGDMWPKTAALMIVTHDGETLLAKREMRFAVNQTATVKFLKAAKYPAGVTLYIKPRWEDRGYGSGIRLRCS